MELEQLTERLDRLTRLVERGIVAIEALSTQLRGQQSAAPVTNELWTVDEAAGFLRCSKSKVYREAETGHLPRLQIGGHLRFEPEVVRAYARGEVRPLSARVVQLPTPHH